VRKRVRKVNVDYIKFLYGCLGFIVAQSFSSVLDARLFFSVIFDTLTCLGLIVALKIGFFIIWFF